MKFLLQATGIGYIATCQRVVWVIQPARRDSDASLRSAYLAMGRTVPEPERHEGFAAFRHLAEIAASMDALVPGEPQVLGQVRAAVKQCDEWGVLGRDLHHVFDLVFRTAKAIRSKTRFFEGKVSILPLAAEAISRAIGTRTNPVVAILGTGEMAAKTARMLRRMAPSCRLTVVSRDPARARAAAHDSQAVPLTLEEFVRNPPTLDAAVLTMEVREAVLTSDWLAERAAARPLTVVDLAMPRNAERPSHPIAGLELLQLDELAAISEAGRAHRGAAYEDAVRVLEDELDRIEQDYNQRCHASAMHQLAQRFQAVAEERWRQAHGHVDLGDRKARKWYEQTVRALLHEAAQAVKGGMPPR